MSDSTDGGKNDKNDKHDKHEKHDKGATTPQDPDANMEELRQNIRKAEVRGAHLLSILICVNPFNPHKLYEHCFH